MLAWDQVRRHFYRGSWRDIVVVDTSNAEWTAMLQWLRESGYALELTRDGEPGPVPEVADDALWKQRHETCHLLCVRVPGTPKCHFFGEGEIEFDIDPSEIGDDAGFAALAAFMRGLGQAVRRPVLITPENRHEIALFRYDPLDDRFEDFLGTQAEYERLMRSV